MSTKACGNCEGTRLNKSARNIFLKKERISDLTQMNIEELLSYFKELKLQGTKREIAKGVVKEIIDRLEFLSNVGLNYLNLERSAETLSGGESQRIRLASQIGSGLVGVMYILDEPTIGLDPRQSAITRKMMDRLRGEVSFILSSHILSEVEACCDRMIILSHGQIVAEGTLYDLQKKFVNKTIFEIVATSKKIDIQKEVRKLDASCELLQDDPVEVSGKRRFTFSTDQGEPIAEKIVKSLLLDCELRISEFQISRPDLETIFLRATKKNWDKKDFLIRKKFKN